MRVGFAGTPEFAVQALAAIHDAGHTIPLLLTQPDRPHGRGMKSSPSAVKAYACRHDLPLLQPASLKSEADRAQVLAIPLDVLVVAAYGLILPPAVLAWPRHGCLNVHASLLPRWRGAAPIARAIEAGDTTTGISIMQMDPGLDTGPVIETEHVAIGPRDTAGSLQERLAGVGARAIVRALDRLRLQGWLEATPQPRDGASYAAKIGREEAAIDWTLDAPALDRRIRAFDPAPGAFATLAGKVVKVADAKPVGGPSRATPGSVLAIGRDGMDVACGKGTILRIGTVRPAGGRSMPAAAFAAGRALLPGARFDPPG